VLRPHKLRIVYKAEGYNAETLAFTDRRARDAAHDVFKESEFVLSVESWDELHSVPKLIRDVAEA
jgi:hypothetical protein